MRGKTAEDRSLLELLDPVAEASGYEIVRLRLMGGEHARRLQIMAETPDGEMIVLGGGNTAMDCCRTAKRLGGEDVKVIVRVQCSSRQRCIRSPMDRTVYRFACWPRMRMPSRPR